MLHGDPLKDRLNITLSDPIRAPAATEKQHPKPIPTPEKVEVF